MALLEPLNSSLKTNIEGDSAPKIAEIAANFMTTFYCIQVGALETQELRTTPVPY
jgi:hypothetical protein